MKSIEVVAAVIIADNKVFTTQRGYGDYKDYWEFPGGKIEAGETPQQALEREIREELNTVIDVGEFIGTTDYEYPVAHVTLHFYACSVLSGELQLLEHEDARWLGKHELDSVNWLPADEEIIPQIHALL